MLPSSPGLAESCPGAGVVLAALAGTRADVMTTVAPSEFIVVYTTAGTCEVWSTVLPGATIEAITILADAVAAAVKRLSVVVVLPASLVVLTGILITAA